MGWPWILVGHHEPSDLGPVNGGFSKGNPTFFREIEVGEIWPFHLARWIGWDGMVPSRIASRRQSEYFEETMSEECGGMRWVVGMAKTHA